jgi:hypothetical protein
MLKEGLRQYIKQIELQLNHVHVFIVPVFHIAAYLKTVAQIDACNAVDDHLHGWRKVYIRMAVGWVRSAQDLKVGIEIWLVVILVFNGKEQVPGGDTVGDLLLRCRRP